jgi:antitoxin MazE
MSVNGKSSVLDKRAKSNYNVITMQIDIIPIGNSKGVRIPKAFLEQCGLGGTVEMRVEKNRLILEAPRRKPREGWAEAAKQCHAAGDDKLLWPEDMQDDFDADWEWPGKA